MKARRPMLTDTELILSAVTDKPTRRQTKKKILQEFGDYEVCEFSDIDPKLDALTKLSKKIKRRENKEKRKSRAVAEWTNTDFLVFAQDQLKVYNIYLENNGSFGADLIGRLYDRLAAVLQDDMNNKVLKEYIEWWITSFGPGIKTHSLFIQTIYDEKYVVRFLNRYNDHTAKMPQEVAASSESEQSDETIYKTGGLSMLLMSRGIVTTHTFLRGETGVFTMITKALRSFSAVLLKKTMETTIKKAPYPSSEKVDFISIARPALDLHGLKQYLNLDYTKYFKKETRG